MAMSVVLLQAASDDYQYFYIEDLSSSFVRTAGSIASEISLSDTVYEGVFMKLITDNAVFAFVSILSSVSCALLAILA